MSGQVGYRDTITNGLILNLDAANTKSYPGSGTDWNDLSGYNNNSTLVNNPTFNSSNGGHFVFSGTNGNGNKFNSTDQYVNKVSPNIPLGSSPRTVSCWLNAVTTTSIFPYVFYGNGIWASTTRSVFTLALQSVSIGSPPFINITTWSDDFNSPTGYISYNTWFNCTVTYNGANTILVYINGNLIGTKTLVSTLNTVLGSKGLSIATWADGQWCSWKGKISNCMIYNRALTATEVLQNYNSTKARFGL
jgi:hypothetical protein